MKVIVMSLALLSSGFLLTGCFGKTIQHLENLPDDHKGAKVFYAGNGDEIAVGGGKGVHYERSF